MISFIFIGLGGLIAVVGAIMVLVAAFRQSLGWGFATLFLPFANLAFVIVHWAEARAGFLVSLAGGAVMGVGIATSPVFHTVAGQAGAFLPPQIRPISFSLEKAAQSSTPAPDLNVQIQQQRDRIEQLEAKFAQEGTTLVQQFQQLTAQRQALKTGDNAAVNAFNADAATYQARNTYRQRAKAELDNARAELDVLIDQRSRQKAAPAAAASAKRVVIYTTASCPACKMAKTYFAQKGVPFEERDVNGSPAARAEFQKLGGRGVPLILVGTERMEGFSAQRLDQLL